MKKSMVAGVAVAGFAAVVFAQSGMAFAAVEVRANAAVGASAGIRGIASSSLGAAVNGRANTNAGTGAHESATATANQAGVSVTVGSSAAQSAIAAHTGLQAVIKAGGMNTSSESEIVNLQNNTALLIETSTDLDAYDRLVVAARPAVWNVAVKNDGTVAVTYAQPAKFLGLFPAMLAGQVDVNASGTTVVQLPWYAFLYAQNTSGVQTAVNTAVAASGADFSAASQEGTAVGLQNKARIINAVTAALQAEAEANASTSASTATSSGDIGANATNTASVTSSVGGY